MIQKICGPQVGDFAWIVVRDDHAIKASITQLEATTSLLRLVLRREDRPHALLDMICGETARGRDSGRLEPTQQSGIWRIVTNTSYPPYTPVRMFTLPRTEILQAEKENRSTAEKKLTQELEVKPKGQAPAPVKSRGNRRL